MRILVIGAGMIGSIYGWALSDCGHDVVHLVRRGRATALRDSLTVRYARPAQRAQAPLPWGLQAGGYGVSVAGGRRRIGYRAGALCAGRNPWGTRSRRR